MGDRQAGNRPGGAAAAVRRKAETFITNDESLAFVEWSEGVKRLRDEATAGGTPP
jgi:hypothetical protein